MKKIIIIALAAAIPLSSAAQLEEIKTKVERVVLHQGSAEVSRGAKVRVGEGRARLVFGGIPQSVNPDSIRVRGQGDGKLSISGVELKPKRLGDDVSKYAAQLESKINGLEKDLRALALQKERAQKQRAIVQAVQLDKAALDPKQSTRPRTPQEMGQVLDFISEASAKLDAEEAGVDDKVENLKKDLAQLQAELTDVKTGGKQETVVEVSVSADKALDASLTLSYQISGAGWRPSYNFNFISGGKEPEFVLDTYAVAFQNTGEDWGDVELVFSTARSDIGLNRPTASPRTLDVFEAAPLRLEAMSLKGAAARAPRAADAASDANVAGPQIEAVEDLADMSALGIVSFALPTRVDLRSGSSVEKFKISEAKLKGQIRNIAVPTISSSVYREAKLQNTMSQPLLPGEVLVFSNGSFVGRQSLGYTPQNQEMSLSIGLSDDISVSRKQTKKFEDDSGLVRSVRRLRNGYEIEVENHGGAPAIVNLIEPAPLSRNEKIKVTMGPIDPPPLAPGDEKRVQKEEGIIEWSLSLPAKGKVKASYESGVEFAQGVNVSGIEDL